MLILHSLHSKFVKYTNKNFFFPFSVAKKKIESFLSKLQKQILGWKVKKRFHIILSSFFLLVGCNIQELKIMEVLPCEYSLQNGECEISLKEKKDYNIIIPKDSKIESWNQLSNFIYFKSRISTGFIIKFNRPFLFKEKEIISSSYKSFYNFNGTSGSVDGFDIGDDYVYSFIYIGNLLKEKQREKKEDNKSFGKIQNLSFPVTLSYKSDLFSGELQTTQDIKVTKE